MITCYPNAKINIGLNVTARRPDGYHNIETVFYPINLQDTLHLASSGTSDDYNFSAAGIELSGDTEDNLIIKALRLMRTEYNIPPLDISLHKQIPFGAGLGGGSSDAAFMLKALNELFELNASPEKLEELAAMIGADCPFFIRNEPVFAEGIGNIFTPVELSLKNYYIALIKPHIFISTPQAFAGISPQQPETSLKELIALPVEAWKNRIVNDFEASVFKKHPAIAAIKEELYRLGAIYASMSGSGSSVYGIFSEEPLYSPLFDDCFVVAGKLD